jgi:hypothetical protein
MTVNGAPFRRDASLYAVVPSMAYAYSQAKVR